MNPRICRRETIAELRKEMETERDSLALITKEFIANVKRVVSDGTLTRLRYAFTIVTVVTAIFIAVVTIVVSSNRNQPTPIIINVPYGYNQPVPYGDPRVVPRPYPDHYDGAYLIPLVIPPRHHSH